MKRIKLKEDAPVNNVGGGNLAGMGVHGAANQEPGVPKKKQARNKSPILFPQMMKRTMPNNIKESKYILPTIKYKNKIYRGKSGESHDAVRARHGFDSLPPSEKTEHGYIDDRGRYYGDDDSSRSRAFGYAKNNGLVHSKYEKMSDDIGLHATMLKEDFDTFAGSVVFEVSSGVFHNVKTAKRKGQHWRTYLGEDDTLAEIREYANKNPHKPIIVKNKLTSEMCYVRYGKKRG